MRLVHSTPNPEMQSPPFTLPELPLYEVVRVACASCGTHTNALRGRRLDGTCRNCGGFELVVVDGAAPMAGPIPAHAA